ncbi:DNA-directed RNA polymerase sigma-70 factor [Nitrospira sp. KM1]|uniref:sigma-70 family RNA polymerase sigma factor n=1 Tax=Nitrospira sp. KM1 TaxID=1936990 RepID=UPI0013A762FF|nr:sigma-70 family RNA polymerase sigma factor [Nitrospira sp. KM1]BCA56582.1 DNA-directed RNA polymerase sigma-70 factor [Nitrospira sp. KM1]
MDDEQQKLELYLNHRGELINYAAGIVGCRMMAEDVVQEAYLRFHRPSERPDVTTPVGYLFRIVRNLAVDWARRLALERRHVDIVEDPPAVAEDRATPEETASHRQELALVLEALAELPDRTRQALEMHRFGGMTLEEIGRRLEISPALAHGLIHKALIHCQARLRTKNPDR